MKPGWQSYDAAAAIHDELAVPGIFARPAADLVDAVGIPADANVLDVGTGTGVAALAAAKFLGRGGIIVGLDPSVPMLRRASAHGLHTLVAATLPGLPFTDETFDRVLASFVLSHVDSYEAALLEITRVLKPGGKLGLTTWGPLEDEFRERWRSVAESFVSKEALADVIRKGAPFEEWFMAPGHTRQALEEAGLLSVAVHHNRIGIRSTVAEFLELRKASFQARFMQEVLEAPRWEEFRRAVEAEFNARFNGPIEYSRDFYVAVGTRSE